MDDTSLIKTVIGIIASSVGGFLVWCVKKSSNRMDLLEKRMSDNEKDLEVLSERVDNMREDLKEIKAMLQQLLTMSRRSN